MLHFKALDTLAWDEVETFCKERVAENAHVDYKLEFPTRLEKTIAAMANTLGGLILIGVDEDDETRPILPLAGVPFQRGLSERVMNIDLGNITPPVFPDIGVCKSPAGDKAVVVIRVPQSHQTPHAISANTEVYLRTGNVNTPEALAKVHEVEWLQNQREKSVEFRDALYERAENRFKNLYYDSVTDLTKRIAIISSRIPGPWLTLSLCAQYPKGTLVATPPDLGRALDKIRVPDYYSTAETFPPIDPAGARIVQNGLVSNVTLGEESVYHVELNCYGLYFYKQHLAHNRVKSAVGDKRTIRATEIFCRIDEFLNSANLFFDHIGYRGYLQYRIVLDDLLDSILLPYGDDRARLPNLGSPDYALRSSEVFRAEDLRSRRFEITLSAAQKVGWTFGWHLPPSLLERYFRESRPSVLQ